MDIIRRIDEMTDDDTQKCLNAVLEGMVAASPALEEVLSSPEGEDASEIIRKAAAQVSVPEPGRIAEGAITDRRHAVKVILKEMAINPELKLRIENWLATPQRAELFEPITTALVLAGIVAVLSTDVDFHYEDKEGKRHLRIAVHKKANTETLLSKFFGLFGGK